MSSSRFSSASESAAGSSLETSPSTIDMAHSDRSRRAGTPKVVLQIEAPMAEPKGPEKQVSPAALAKSAASLTTTADPATLSGLHVVVQIPAQPGAGAHGRPERRAFHAADIDTVCKYWS